MRRAAGTAGIGMGAIDYHEYDKDVAALEWVVAPDTPACSQPHGT